MYTAKVNAYNIMFYDTDRERDRCVILWVHVYIMTCVQRASV